NAYGPPSIERSMSKLPLRATLPLIVSVIVPVAFGVAMRREGASGGGGGLGSAAGETSAAMYTALLFVASAKARIVATAAPPVERSASILSLNATVAIFVWLRRAISASRASAASAARETTAAASSGVSPTSPALAAHLIACAS